MTANAPTLLVVDDVPSFREIIKDMLIDIGFPNVIEAADGSEALEKVRSQEVALVISDYMMSPKTGIDLLEGLKSDDKLKCVPFIMVSAVSEVEIQQRAIALGANGFIPRPISFDTLRKKVIDALCTTMS